MNFVWRGNLQLQRAIVERDAADLISNRAIGLVWSYVMATYF